MIIAINVVIVIATIVIAAAIIATAITSTTATAAATAYNGVNIGRGVHFCYLCGYMGEDGNAVYDHLMEKHGRIYLNLYPT